MCPSTFWFHVVIGAAVSNRIQPEEELGCPAQQKKQPGRNQHQPRDRFWFSESLGGISKVWLLVFALSSSSKLTVTSRPLSFTLCRTSVFLFCCCSVAAEINDCILHSSISDSSGIYLMTCFTLCRTACTYMIDRLKRIKTGFLIPFIIWLRQNAAQSLFISRREQDGDDEDEIPSSFNYVHAKPLGGVDEMFIKKISRRDTEQRHLSTDTAVASWG
ncbi:hypothetical protein OUZ56_000383 [Daphnia magna]|uniref:Uncharacterized protein n=1 Tax=Daphnia magna TaxID=35525 RepID=A0ABQ9ZZI3_9CRUS|nr:hypothetical protein OUZ56_000383 [Daphnia magna]